jgi:DNA repair protein RecN (Recombination protein N)
MDRVSIRLGENDVSVLSGGEFNRLRLALMSASSSREDDGGIIFLDEIDANVSGDESIAIADMIAHLSRNHQIFAISHQAHLSSQANQHIVVRKDAGKSVAYSLEEKERIREIARIISGEKADREALAFAEKLRKRE